MNFPNINNVNLININPFNLFLNKGFTNTPHKNLHKACNYTAELDACGVDIFQKIYGEEKIIKLVFYKFAN